MFACLSYFLLISSHGFCNQLYVHSHRLKTGTHGWMKGKKKFGLLKLFNNYSSSEVEWAAVWFLHYCRCSRRGTAPCQGLELVTGDWTPALERGQEDRWSWEYFPFTLHFIPHFSLDSLGLQSHGCPSEGSVVSTLLKVSPCVLLSHFPRGPLHRSSLFILMILITHIQTWHIAGRPICVQVAAVEMCVTVC